MDEPAFVWGAGDPSPAGVQGRRPWRGVGRGPTKAAPREGLEKQQHDPHQNGLVG